MAIYHVSAQIIGRSAGRSSVAAAAYRSAERIRDERTGQIHDYTKRHGIESEIHTPGSAPEWMRDRSRLWNAAEEAETRKDAQLAREMNIALPKELSADEQKELVRSFVKEEFVNRGMVADVAYHHNDPDNPHAHVMLTLRDVTPEGFGSKNRNWNHRDLLEAWREKWEEHANQALERAGRNERIDHRTLEAQGINREPARHLGPAAAAMERKHIPTERMAEAGMVREYNDNLLRFREEKARLETLQQERREHARLAQAARRQNWEMRSPRPPGEIKHERREGERLTTTRRRSQLAEQERFWSGRHAHAIKSLESAKHWRDSPAGLKANWDYWKSKVAEGSKHPVGLMFSQKDRNMLRYAKRREFDAMVTYRTRAAYEAIKGYAGKAVALAKQEITRLRETPSQRRTDQLLQQGYWDREGARAVATVERIHKHTVGYLELRESLVRTSSQLHGVLGERATAAKEAADASRRLGSLSRLEGQWRRADAAVRQLESPSEKAKRLFSDHARQDYMNATMQRDRLSAEYWRLVKNSGFSDGTQLRGQLRTVTSEAEARLSTLERRGKILEHRLRIYQGADDAFARQAEARLKNDPEIKRRHEERLSSGRWDLEYCRALRLLEAREGRPLTRAELERLARGKDWNSPEGRAWLGQQRAQELQDYQARANVDPAARNRELEQRLRENRRDAMADLRPAQYQRLLDRERDANTHRHIHTRRRPG